MTIAMTRMQRCVNGVLSGYSKAESCMRMKEEAERQVTLESKSTELMMKQLEDARVR